MKRFRLEKETLIVVIISLMVGCFGILIAGGWATRFRSKWVLNTNVDSRLDPDSYYLTSQPVNFVEPLDPAILTSPPWFDIFLTPGTSFDTKTPVPPDFTPVIAVPTNNLSGTTSAIESLTPTPQP